MWAPGTGIYPLGLDQLRSQESKQALLVVEGATDYAAARQDGFAVLGVPGSSTWKPNWSKHLEGYDTVVIWRENDQGGQSLVRAIAQSYPSVRVIDAPPEAKDVCELRQMDPANFKARLQELIDNARPLDQSDVEAGNKAGGRNPTIDQDPSTEQQIGGSIADRALCYVEQEGVELFTDRHGEACMTFRNLNDLMETSAVRSGSGQRFIIWLFYKAEGKGLPADSVKTVQSTLEAKAHFEGVRKETYLRVAALGEDNLYDLGNGQTVTFSRDGWSISQDSQVAFRRYDHQAVQVTPLSGGSLDEFFELLNMSDPRQILLLKTYLVAALFPGSAMPILIVYGEQGSAKSMLLKFLKCLLDPSELLTMTAPESPKEFIQIASHHRVVFFDNCSSLPEWLSDALCRFCTGDGFSKRRLYFDDSDFIYSIQGLAGVNGINMVGTKPDLLDRSIVVQLDTIPSSKRLPESDLWKKFESLRPQILGSMFEVAVQALNSSIDPSANEDLPRLADFAIRGMAIADSLDKAPGEFSNAYWSNVGLQNEIALEESPIAQSVLHLMKSCSAWSGTPTKLLVDLEHGANELHISTKASWWPKGPSILSKRLEQVIPNLRRVGIHAMRRRSDGGRLWEIYLSDPEVVDSPVPPDPVDSPPHDDAGNAGPGVLI